MLVIPQVEKLRTREVFNLGKIMQLFKERTQCLGSHSLRCTASCSGERQERRKERGLGGSTAK